MTPAVVTPVFQTVVYVVDNPIQRAAFEYHDLGFNIGPTKVASKHPHRWRILVGTRITRDYILPLFDNGAGIFVLTGRLSMNLAILDCDTFKEAERQAKEFQVRGLSPWRVNTARGAHFWWLSADGELANVKNEGFEIWGNTHYCLCPPSIHPTGVIYEWAERPGLLPPVLNTSTLDWLPLKPCARNRDRFELAQIDTDPLSCLSKRTRDFIRRGASEGTRNTRLFAAACDMAGNEFTRDEALDTLVPSARTSGLSHSEITTTIKSAFSKPRSPSKTARSDLRSLPAWVRARQWAAAYQWVPMCTTWTNPKNGKVRTVSVTAQTARDVFLACCERCRRDSSEVFRASRREVAELANVGCMTAHRALLCLLAAGLLIQREHSAIGAGLFAFGESVLRETYSTPYWSDISVAKSNTHSDARDDVFRRGALGKTAERIWLSTLPPNGPASKAEIARRAKCSKSTVTRLLSSDGLPKWGLVSEIDDGRWIGNPADDRYLVEIAVKSGTAGKAAQRRRKHAADRAIYASVTILRAKRKWEQIHLKQQD